ncbi:glycine cleavage system P protein, partial [Kipferlia bialata]|eukprot:g11348.t1
MLQAAFSPMFAVPSIPSLARAFSEVKPNIRPSKGLQIAEPLLNEISGDSRVGVYVAEAEKAVVEAMGTTGLDGLTRSNIGIPSVSEPDVMRHYVRLSTRNFSIDHGMYPLGSCTMKYNPRINESVARLPGFADVHPMQPTETVQGCLQVLHDLQQAFLEITGMDSVTLTPAAGSHGEHAGLMAIRAALVANGRADHNVCLMPESAHGTNPASAIMAGFKTHTLRCNRDGSVNMDDLKHALETLNVGCMMLTNPNTVGMFETDICEMTKLIHEAGGYFYMDGANLNAIMGQSKP